MRPLWTYWRWWLWAYRSAADGWYVTVLGWRFHVVPDGRAGQCRAAEPPPPTYGGIDLSAHDWWQDDRGVIHCPPPSQWF